MIENPHQDTCLLSQEGLFRGEAPERTRMSPRGGVNRRLKTLTDLACKNAELNYVYSTSTNPKYARLT